MDDIRNGTIRRYEVICRNGNDEFREIDFSVYPVEQDESLPPLYIAEGKDIHDIREKEREIYRLAFYDAVTGLPNQKLFSRTIDKLLVSGDQQGAFVAVIKVGSLGFVNTMFGFAAGDEFLRAFSRRLAPFMRKGCFVGKLMGGNFGIYFPPHHEDGEDPAYVTLGEVCSPAAGPLKFLTHEMHITTFIGAAAFPDHGLSYEELMKHAVAARDESKGNSSNCIEYFDSSITEKLERKRTIEQTLRSTDLEKLLDVQFQPQVFIADGSIDGFEALIRWNDPVMGKISPLEFISIAESTGTIGRIFSYVAERSAAFIAAAGRTDFRVSINVSADQLIDESLPSRLASIIDPYKIPYSTIALEITESLLIESLSGTLPMLTKMRNLGFQIYLDDFGTGFSSLSYLRHLPIDHLKIDKSFIDDIDRDEKSKRIVGSIVRIAHDLDISVVAEGVETEAQAAILKEFDCDLSQGWLTGRPLYFDDALSILESKKTT
jgi:diguanylate cyclase